MSWKSRIPEVIATAEGQIAAAIEKAVLDIEAGAKERSRVDTGTMKNAWQHEQEGPFEGRVFNGVEYAIYNELGTAHMSAQPMLIPAVEEARPGLEAAVKSAFK